MSSLQSLGRAVSAAGAIASIITIFQSGDEAYAVLQALQCNSSHTTDLLTNTGFETFMVMSLPIALFLFLFATYAERKADESTPGWVNMIFYTCKTLSLHLPIILIIILTVIVTQSVCDSVANQDVESIRVMGWSYVVLGISFTLSTLSGGNLNADAEHDAGIFNWMYLVEYIFHAAVLFLIGVQLHSDDIYTKPNTECTEHYNEFNYQFLPSNHRRAWVNMAYTFGSVAIIEFMIHLLDIVSPRMYGARLKLFDNTFIKCLRRVLAIVARLFICLFVAGLVMECSMTGCRPFADETSSTFKAIVIMSTVSFIPTLLTQQLEWDADTVALKQLYNWINEGRSDPDLAYNMLG